MKCVTVSGRCHSLCCYLDELLEELDSLAELWAEAHLGDHPQLNVVEPPQKQVQISRCSPEALPAKRVVEQLMLEGRREETWRGAGLEVIQWTGTATLHLWGITPVCFYCSIRIEKGRLQKKQHVGKGYTSMVSKPDSSFKVSNKTSQVHCACLSSAADQELFWKSVCMHMWWYLMHTAEELPVVQGHLVSQVLGAHQLKRWHGACRRTFLFWKRSLRHGHKNTSTHTLIFTY